MKQSTVLTSLFFIGIIVSCHKDDPAPTPKQLEFYVSTKAFSSQTGQAELTASHVSIISGVSLFDKDQIADINKVNVNDGNLEYTLTVSKGSYITYTKTFSSDELKAFTQNSPLVVTLLDQSLTNGLVACYSLNGNARDCSGNYNDATLHGGSLTTDHLGNSNDAYQFNGTSDYISLPVSALKNNNYSYSIWMKINALPASGTAVCVFSLGDVTTSQHQTLALANNYSSGNVTGMSVGGYNNGSPVQSSVVTSLPTAGQWYHIVGVRSSSSLKMYVNGTLVGSSDAGTTTPYYGTTVAANLGARCNLTQFFGGVIDNFLLYNRVISDQEIKVLYLEGLPCQ
jgi:hypothetical protein